MLFVEEPDGLRPEEFARLRQLGSALATRCDVLAHSGIAPTVDHSDLHDGNVFVQDGSYAVFDWGDASLTHPFASLLVTMSALGARYGVSSDAPVLQRLRDAYLEPWTGTHARPELVELAAHAVALAPINRALSWERALERGAAGRAWGVSGGRAGLAARADRHTGRSAVAVENALDNGPRVPGDPPVLLDERGDFGGTRERGRRQPRCARHAARRPMVDR